MVNFWKKICWLVLLFAFSFFLFSPSISAVSEDECRKKQEEDVNAGVACWENLLAEVGQRKTTLKSEIAKFDTRIALTSAQVVQTGRQIKELGEEIVNLGGKISLLDQTLDEISEILIRRIAETYKKGQVDPLSLLFSSKGFSQFVTRYRYLRVIQLHDRKLLVQMETTRTNYDERRQLKEEKQEQEEALKKRLEGQQVLLNQQKGERESFLEVTKNNEKKYQQLLAEAKAQLQKFRSFTVGQGIIDPVDLSDDWGRYYSQLDSRWGSNFIGNSNEQVWEVGCLLTSVAMVWTHFGFSITPAELAADSANFFGTTAYFNRPWLPPPGHTWNPYGSQTTRVPESWIKSEIAGGHPVIVGLIITGGYLADHFVLVREVAGDDLIISDPIVPGLDIKLREQYPSAGLVNAASFH